MLFAMRWRDPQWVEVASKDEWDPEVYPERSWGGWASLSLVAAWRDVDEREGKDEGEGRAGLSVPKQWKCASSERAEKRAHE
jgi:hypothetical protein